MPENSNFFGAFISMVYVCVCDLENHRKFRSRSHNKMIRSRSSITKIIFDHDLIENLFVL